MRTLVRCEKENCTPDTAQLVVSADASEQLFLPDVHGRISEGEPDIRWSNAEANRRFAGRTRDELVKVLGEFATVDVGFDQLKALASAASLEGAIGDQSLNLDADVQSGPRSPTDISFLLTSSVLLP
jgi:hypothetical protein